MLTTVDQLSRLARRSAQVNVSNVLMRVAVPADRPREQLVWATNFFDFAFGFGAFVTPMVLARILRRFRYSKGLLLLAMLATTPVILGAAAEMHPPPAAALSASGPIAQTTAASGSAARCGNEAQQIDGGIRDSAED